MQDIFNIQIEVIDTYDTQSTTPVYVLEHAERDSLRFKGEGGEDKHFTLYKTSLSLSFEVADRTDAKFKSLFTGDEQRYLVRIKDEYDIIHWTGFLLPDQYSEPYTNGLFYVAFTATDGLQSLNGKTLSQDFYRDVKTIPQLLGACLAQTGQNLNIAIAPGMINAYAQDDLNKLAVDTFEWSEDEKISALEILEKVLTTLDAFVVQYRQKWFVLGHNLMGTQFIDCKIYDLNGVFVEDYSLGRSIRSILFEDPATVSTVSPYKRVVVEGDGEFENSLVDQDLIDAPYYQIRRGLLQPQLPIGWTIEGTEVNALNQYLEYVPAGASYGERNEKILHNKVEANQPNDAVNQTTALANWHQLDQFAFVSKEDGLVQVDLSIDVYCNVPQNPKELLEDGFYDTALRFDFFHNNKVIISNWRQVDGSIFVENNFQLDESNEARVRLRTEQFIPNLNITEPGYITFRIYLKEELDWMQTRVALIQLTALQMNLIFERSLKQVVTRDIAFTPVYKNSIGFYPLQSSQVNNQLYVIDAVPAVFDYTIAYTAGTENSRDVAYFSLIDYFKLIEYKEFLYIIPQPGDAPVKIAFEDLTFDMYYFDQDLPLQDQIQYFYFNDLSIPWEFGTSVLKILNNNASLKKQDQSLVEAREQWQKVTNDSGTPRSLAKCIAESYMDRYAEPQYAVEGTAFDIYNPLDIIQFDFDGARSFMPLRVDNDLNAGTCNLYMIENTIQSNQDYEYSK